MEKKLLLQLKNHDIYYVKTEIINYYLAISKKFSDTSICLELKNKMDNYNLELNDEVWVMENIKNTYSYIDDYNITLVIPVLNKDDVSILEKIDTSNYEKIDKILGYVINNSYSIITANKIKVNSQVILINNDRYKGFINWFITKYQNRVICQNLLELIRVYNVNATSYKKLESPGITFVVGSYNTEVDAPKVVKPKEDALDNLNNKRELLQASSGFTSYWLLVIITIVISLIISVIAFLY